MATVTNGNPNVFLFVTQADDSINNTGENVTIAGADYFPDMIENSGGKANISTAGGDDVILNYGEYAIIDAGNGNDSVDNTGEYALIFGGDGNNTLRNSGNNSVLIGGKNGNNILISESGDDVLIGGTDNNTLIGGDGANIFVHSDGANDLITNYSQANDIIVLSSGKVVNSLTTSNGDVILSISKDKADLGTITVQSGAYKYLTIYDEDYLNKVKEDVRDLTVAQVKAAIKTFEEDETVQSILINGDNSEILQTVKTINPELAQKTAQYIKTTYEQGKKFLAELGESIPTSDASQAVATSDDNVFFTSSNVAENISSSHALSSTANSAVDDVFDGFSYTVDGTDLLATWAEHIKKFGKNVNETGANAGKITTPLSVGMNLSAWIGYNAALYSDNLIPAWQDSGQLSKYYDRGDWLKQLSENIAKIRSYNKDTFDGFVTSNISVLSALFGTAVVAGMALANLGAAPIVITATAAFVIPIVANDFYKKIIAPKLDDIDYDLPNRYKDNFANFSEGMGPTAYKWLHAIYTGASYSEHNYEDNIIFYGTPGNDRLRNSGRDVFIAAGFGDDYIINYAKNVRVAVGSGNNTISGGATVTAGDGNNLITEAINVTVGNGDNIIRTNETIENDNSVCVVAGSGNNRISVNIYGGEINVGSGDNVINCYYYPTPPGEDEDTRIVTVGDGNNQIRVSGNSNTVMAGSGDNYIYFNYDPIYETNDGLIKTGNGNNTVTGFVHSDGVNITTGTGDDFISVASYYLSIDAGEGNNTVIAKAFNGSGQIEDFKIKTGAGEDFISFDDNIYGNLSIDVGEGNNTIIGGSNIKTGAGNDYIKDGSSIDAGDGNNTIISSSNIKTGAGNDFISLSGGTIDAGDGNNTIIGGGTIKTGSGNDYIEGAWYPSIDAGDGNNTIFSNGNGNVTTGSGDDIISLSGYSTICAGEGNNTIFSYGSTVTTGDGEDFISLKSYGNTSSSIDAGNGNNTIIGGGTIKAGSGDDLVSLRSNCSCNAVDVGDGNNVIICVSSDVYFYNTIQAGDGEDFISLKSYGNTSSSIDAGNGNNTIFSSGKGNVTTGSGDDFISLSGGTIDAGEGNNTIIGGNGTIKTGSGNDFISLSGGTIDAGEGNNTIIGGNGTIKTGSGNDFISLSGGTIDAGDGNNTILGSSTGEVTTGSGDDFISLSDSSSIDAGDGNNIIFSGKYSKVTTGSGDDFVSLVAGGDIVTGDGNNTVFSSGNRNLVTTGSGDDFIFLSGRVYHYSSIDAGDGNNNIIITESRDYTTITTGVGDDLISLSGEYALRNKFTTSDGNDTIKSAVRIHFNTIDSGAGDDAIIISGGVNVINLGDGDNYISSERVQGYRAGESTITAGDGNDTILIDGGKNLIISGGGNDFISIKNGNNSIEAGDDNDTIFLNGSENNLIQTGGGKDTIFGYHLSNSMQINGTYIVTHNGNNIMINFGSNSVLLKDFTEDVININNKMIMVGGVEGEEIEWQLNDTTATYGTASKTLLTVKDVKSTDGLSVDLIRKIVTVSDSALNQADITIEGKGYSLALDSAVKAPEPVKAHFDGLTYKSDSYTEGYELDSNENKIKYTAADESTDLFTLTGVKNTDGLEPNDNGVVTIKEDNLNGKDVTITGKGYSLALDLAVKTSQTTEAHFDGLTYKSASTSEGYSLSSDKKSINYTSAVAETDLFTLTNVKNTDSITVNHSNKTVTLSANNLTGKNVSITGDYSLKLGNDVSTSTTKTAGSFTKFKSGTATFKTTAYSDFYSLKNNQVTYTAVSGGKTITIKNLNSSTTLDAVKSGITITEQKNGSCKITFKSSDLLTTKAPVISATDATYTVALDKSLNPSALAPDWKVSGTNTSLKSDTSAGYTVSDNKVLYSKKVTGAPQLVLGGLVKNSSLSVPVKKVVTLDTKVLGSNVSLKSNAGSYIVKLTGNMSKKTFTGSANADSLNIAANNAAVLGGAGNDSFTVSGSKVTITGGKGNDSFKLSGKNPMLIYNTNDGNDTVNFIADMQISLSGSTQIKTLGKSGSDLLLGFGKNSSVKVTGAKSTDTLKVSDASGSVTLVAGKFDLANSLTFNSKNSSVTVTKNFSGSLAPSDDIYLGGSKLSSVATINAGNVTSEITISGNAKANFISAGKNNDSILGGNGNDSIAGNAGNDKLYGQNGNDSLSGGAGNDSLWGGDGKDVFIYSAGNDVIADFTFGQDKIQIASGKISKTALSSSDVLFTIGKGSLTVKNAKGKTISLLDSAGKASSTVVGAQTLTNSNKANVTIGTDMGAVDSSKRTKAIKITGNALANSISGGTKNDSIFGAAGNDSILGNAGNDKLYGDAGNDILLGGKGNDSLWGGAGNDSLWGDAGKDTFIYTANEGTDKIFDYSTGDLLKILNVDGSYGSFKSSKYSGGDLTLSINGGGKIIFDDVTSTTKFNINGSYYNISGSKLVKK